MTIRIERIKRKNAMNHHSALVPDKRSRFRGCLLGGAVGDALGYPIEFQKESEIFRRYGKDGIRELRQAGRPALVSDDTQMTLFAANGIILGDVWAAYQEWLGTQGDKSRMDPSHPRTWLFSEPRLHARRAPGNTCLSAIRDSENGGSFYHPLNQSKGCGTVMRAAPFGLCVNHEHAYGQGDIAVYKKAAQDAVSTHGHPMAILSSNALAQVIYEIVQVGTAPGTRLESVIEKVLGKPVPVVNHSREGASCMKSFNAGVRRAIRLAQDPSVSDLTGIHALGEGWIAEEAFYIAVFCAVRFQDRFAEAIRAAVNHSGDSDSTGAVCGNILGAWLGEEAVRKAFRLEDLELTDVILTTADRLYDYQDQGAGPKPAADSAAAKSGAPMTHDKAPRNPVRESRFPSPLINYYEFPNGTIVKEIRNSSGFDPVTGKLAKFGVFRYIPESRTWKEDPALTAEFAYDHPYGEVCEHLRGKADLSEDLPPLPDLKNLSVGSTFCLGAWPQFGGHDFYPVEWQVLDVTDGTALCMSSLCLMTAGYCDFDGAKDPKTGVLKNMEALTWQKSLARRKCRGFYKEAFSEEEKELLIKKRIPAGDEDVYCEDPVFLLSEEEICRLLPSPSQRQAEASYAAKASGALCWRGDEIEEHTFYWVLPEEQGSGGHRIIHPKAVTFDGTIHFHGRNIYHKDYTVRPCILLKI